MRLTTYSAHRRRREWRRLLRGTDPSVLRLLAPVLRGIVNDNERCCICNEPRGCRIGWSVDMPDGTVREEGCYDCWSAQASKAWWDLVHGPPRPMGVSEDGE